MEVKYCKASHRIQMTYIKKKPEKGFEEFYHLIGVTKRQSYEIIRLNFSRFIVIVLPQFISLHYNSLTFIEKTNHQKLYNFCLFYFLVPISFIGLSIGVE